MIFIVFSNWKWAWTILLNWDTVVWWITSVPRYKKHAFVRKGERLTYILKIKLIGICFHSSKCLYLEPRVLWLKTTSNCMDYGPTYFKTNVHSRFPTPNCPFLRLSVRDSTGYKHWRSERRTPLERSGREGTKRLWRVFPSTWKKLAIPAFWLLSDLVWNSDIFYLFFITSERAFMNIIYDTCIDQLVAFWHFRETDPLISSSLYVPNF